MHKLNIFLLILAVVCLLLPRPSFSATDVQVEQGLGFLDVATPSLSLSASAATLIGTMPSGTKNIYITVFYGDVLIGNSSDLATGTEWCAAAKIASGTTVKLDGIMTPRPSVWLIPNSGTATAKIAAWGTN